ncbi:chorion peroxidase [Sitodiplosis mosellana]|uniref:chorion peroxidase n=1 Tax=Sitodiplosis mosellana TaxID=263140 RepID=UPI002444F12D|nr:chorion peroxidase [Sitodiplosis mosellana]
MLRFQPSLWWLALLVLISFTFEETCGFSLNKRARSAVTNENFKFQPTPNLVNTNFYKKCDPCPHGVQCVPSIQCPAHVRLRTHEKPQICDLPHGNYHGVCCTTGRNFTNFDKHKKPFAQGRSAVSDVTTNIIKLMNAVVSEAGEHLIDLSQHEEEVAVINPHDQPEFMHNLGFRSSTESEMKIQHANKRALHQVFASRLFKERQNVAEEDFQLREVQAPIDGTPLEHLCDQFPVCPPEASRYRTIDGKCNNPDPRKGLWGAAGSPMERLLPPSYEDGIWQPRLTSVTGSPLTNPRTISRELIKDADRPHPSLNLLFMQFGQFLTHDISLSSSIKTSDGASIRCCTKDGRRILPRESLHFACLPIFIEPDDDFYSQFDQGCMNFVRSALAPDGQCQLGYGKQVSKVTHFIDGSAIYGVDEKTASEVRSFQGGRLRMLDDFGRQLLPLTLDTKTCVSLDKGPCFFAGDFRASQIISLTALHILFAREHNRIADILSGLNPRWSDDVIFFETKRIVEAEIQHIVYNEWLPKVVGTETMQRFGLSIRETGYSDDYNPDVNACITSEFSTAAQRFGHSTVDGRFFVHKGNGEDEVIEIPDVFFNTNRLRQRNFYDEILLTLTRQPMQQVDSALTQGLSKFLFRGSNPFGLDLASINILRGRDHGIRPYNDYVEVTGHSKVLSFDEFGPGVAEKLASVYQSPDDIDLWIGGLIEAARGDGLVGPTFGDIIADQFSKFRQGDRYFYEHSPMINPGAFTPDQLKEIKKTSVARLICDNSDGIQAQSPKAFIRPEIPGNGPIPCGSLPAGNFLPWQV